MHVNGIIRAVAILLVVVNTHFQHVKALDNGLARTPPMGFLSWERFRCTIDCATFPDECISEDLYKSMALVMAADGWLDAGYNYVNIDDCWPELERSHTTAMLVPDASRFPSGMSPLANFMHELGLNLGIYGDCGTKTCGGYPGSYEYFQLDAFTYANWSIDSLKLDGCYSSAELYPIVYPEMGQALNQTHRPILYACSWPAYLSLNETDWKAIVENCNYWRLYDDIQDSWASMINIIHYWGDNQDVLAPLNGPGHFNDPDMIICGDFSLSVDECRVQFALWSLWSAPLFLSTDLRSIAPEFVKILQNKEIIAIDQDPKGEQGIRVVNDTQSVWKKNLASGEIAIVVVNEAENGMPMLINVTWTALGLEPSATYFVRDLFAQRDVGPFSGSFISRVNCHSATMYKLTSKQSVLTQ